MKNELLNVKNLRPIRIVSYSIGVLLIKILIDHQLEIHYDYDHLFYLDLLLKKSKPSKTQLPISQEVKPLIFQSKRITSF